MFRPAKDVLKERWEAARSVNPKYFDRLMERLTNTDNLGSCWEYTLGTNEDGYAHLTINGKKTLAHRAMYQWFYRDHESKVVRHLCNNRRCCNPSHLRGGTQYDNVQDMVLMGRCGDHSGVANGRSKLNEEAVLEIRQSNLSYSQLAKIHGVSRTVIKNVKKRLSWSHI